MRTGTFGTAGTFAVGEQTYRIHRISELTPPGLPYSLRIVLENLLRHEDGDAVTAAQVEAILAWGDTSIHERDFALHSERVFLHDTNGVPTLVDLAAMRHAAAALGADPTRINPVVPAELVVDHSVIADTFGRPEAFELNVDLEYRRNAERYRFLKWGQSTLRNFAVVPPGTGIMHQVNLEYLARVVMVRDGWAFPDLCLGTDSHTTMVNGLGVLGWGIGGIEAEALMLGQSVSMLVPRVVGVRLSGSLPEGATATDLVLTVTELLRSHGVVGKFVEFSGPGIEEISLPDRATIANMSPEFGSTCAYFPIDDETLRYLRFTGRPADQVRLVETYAKEQGLWHRPDDVPRYSEVVELDLASVVPSLAGPSRPQDRVPLTSAKGAFAAALTEVLPEGGSSVDEASRESFPASDAPAVSEPDGAAGRPRHPGHTVDTRAERRTPIDIAGERHVIDHGSVAIAAITSCTNTSNPSVMVGAGLLARNAVERGLRSQAWVKTTLSPGSRVVTSYLDKAGLAPFLDRLGFHLAGYGCMTCIGASGPLIPEVSDAVRDNELSVVAVLSGNRNFESRINPEVRMNYLASPPLVVAYALAGTMDIDLLTEPLGHDPSGTPVFLRDIWPASREVEEVIRSAVDAEMFTGAYRRVFDGDERWRDLEVQVGELFAWDEDSTYLRRPPYLDDMTVEPEPLRDIRGARVLALLGDSVTTDHVSPAGAIPLSTPAGQYLTGLGVTRRHLNTYASRRGNHEVMMRGTFANVRLRNRLVPGVEGGYTLDRDGEVASIYDAAAGFRADGVPLVVIAGKAYGTGSSRDWAAKGPALLGVRAVIAESFERIHRSNLVGMGIVPLQFRNGENAERLGLTGHEELTIFGLSGDSLPATVTVRAGDVEFTAEVRVDTAREAQYLRHGGIMPFMLRQLLAGQRRS